MSKEAAEAFYVRVENEVELQKKLKELGNPKSVERYAKETLGYDFTGEEMQKVVFERSPEMNEDELQQVSGGILDVPPSDVLIKPVQVIGSGDYKDPNFDDVLAGMYGLFG